MNTTNESPGSSPVRLEENLVVVCDGDLLRADVYHPSPGTADAASARVAWPALLTFTTVSKDHPGYVRASIELATHGFVVVVMDAGGCHASDGTFDPDGRPWTPRLLRELARLAEWAKALPWTDTRIGWWGLPSTHESLQKDACGLHVGGSELGIFNGGSHDVDAYLAHEWRARRRADERRRALDPSGPRTDREACQAWLAAIGDRPEAADGHDLLAGDEWDEPHRVEPIVGGPTVPVLITASRAEPASSASARLAKRGAGPETGGLEHAEVHIGSWPADRFADPVGYRGAPTGPPIGHIAEWFTTAFQRDGVVDAPSRRHTGSMTRPSAARSRAQMLPGSADPLRPSERQGRSAELFGGSWSIERIVDHPIVEPSAVPDCGANLNGPSLLRVPPWVDAPLGSFYLYFASHTGDRIHLAVADEVSGPWIVRPEGVLHLSQTPFIDHIASPDVVVDEDRREIRMYFHGVVHEPNHVQANGIATSADGLAFRVVTPTPFGRPYLRMFGYRGEWFGLAMPGHLYRSGDGLTSFTHGHLPFPPRVRHLAVARDGDTLDVVFSRGHDAPERLLGTRIDLSGPWDTWSVDHVTEVLRPERVWEGVSLPVETSRWGAARDPLHELRDPALLVDDGETLLAYAVAGEHGIGLARISRH